MRIRQAARPLVFYFGKKGGEGILTSRMVKFCLAYARDDNATQAAIEAGYSERTAYSQGQRLLKNVEVQEYLQQLANEIKTSKIADAKEMQEVLTSIIRQELEEENLVVEGCGDGVSEAVIKKKKSSHKDVISAIDKLARMQGAYDNSSTLTLVLPVFEGEDQLEE